MTFVNNINNTPLCTISEIFSLLFLNHNRMSKAAYVDYAKRPRKDWVLKHPAQLVLMISQVYWCHDVENALNNENTENIEAILSSYKDQCIKQLEDLSVLVRSDIQPLERRILTALITIDVHARDILEDLIRYLTNLV